MENKTTVTAAAGQLVEDAQELLSATSDIAEEKVVAARKRLAAALQNGREMLYIVKDKAIAGAKAGAKVTDETIREYPYHAIGVALGVGIVVGLLLGRRRN
jgi:ElaB/YqjD/DUF883 family membrane-anchored ribosome-binding protein